MKDLQNLGIGAKHWVMYRWLYGDYHEVNVSRQASYRGTQNGSDSD